VTVSGRHSCKAKWTGPVLGQWCQCSPGGTGNGSGLPQGGMLHQPAGISTLPVFGAAPWEGLCVSVHEFIIMWEP